MKLFLLFGILILNLNQLFAQYTIIPDANFEQALIDLGYDTGTPDGVVPTVNINSITSLDLSSKSISDLTGIEDFSALTYLECDHNQLTSLNVSQNTQLDRLHCYYNQLSSLDISQNTALTWLSCYQNQLTSLDVTQNGDLMYLDCSSNNLSNLNVNQNAALFNLNCSGNEIINLDLTHNTGLMTLNCYDNQLTILDVSYNTDLDHLTCGMNQIDSLNVSQNLTLTGLFCQSNSLKYLNVKNGNNNNFYGYSQWHFDATNNPELTCIEVDDEVWSETYWSDLIDPTACFRNDCTNGCNSSNIVVVKSSKVVVYPNPTSNTVTISFDENHSFRAATLRNNLGQITESQKISPYSQFVMEINGPSGIYLLELTTTSGVNEQIKIIKE